MTHRFKAILFDLDGTIIDSLYDLQKAINSLLALEKHRPLTLNEMRACTGDGLRIMMGKAFAMTGEAKSEEALAKLMPQYLDIYAKIIPQPSCIYEGMLHVLQSQKAAGIKLGLCTNKHEISMRRIMRQLELDVYFDVMVGGDSLAEKKPHPLPLLYTMEKMGAEKSETIMVGDSPNDTFAAEAAGIPSIRAAYGYTPEWPIGAPYTASIDNANELLNTISHL